jgi:hypothetical protein
MFKPKGWPKTQSEVATLAQHAASNAIGRKQQDEGRMHKHCGSKRNNSALKSEEHGGSGPTQGPNRRLKE